MVQSRTEAVCMGAAFWYFLPRCAEKSSTMARRLAHPDSPSSPTCRNRLHHTPSMHEVTKRTMCLHQEKVERIQKTALSECGQSSVPASNRGSKLQETVLSTY